MRIMIKNHILVAIMALAIVPATTKANPSVANCPRTKPEARGLRAVECPAFWPINQGSPLKAAQYSNYRDSAYPPYCVEVSKAGKTSILDVAGQTDLGCDYANGAQLLISVPGVPVECRTLFRKRPHPRQLYYRIACYFKPSGDPGKDKVTTDELQELTRDTEIFGLRLSMTRAEMELALRAEAARIVSSEDKAIHASLPNGKEIAAIYTSRGQTREIDIDASGADDNLYPALQHSFGFPEQIDEIGKSPWSTFWGGESHIRLKIDSLERVPSFSRRLRLIDLNQTE